jgi:hypothetical protein
VTGSAEASVSGGPAGSGTLVLVLPPADRLAPPERVRVRMLVDRALDEVIVTGARPVLLEPATTDALSGAVETAVRRSATVCVIGGDGRAALDAALALYPSRTGCMLPLAGDAGRLLGADVDLEAVGRELGAVARAVAGEGTVLVLDGRDGMLDRRWAAGVLTAAPGAQHVVTSAAELLQLLDDQAASVAAGVVPGSAEARAGSGGDVEFPDREDVPLALVLPPVEVVVLDGSVEAMAVVAGLLEREVRVIGPRSLLLEHPDDASVVLRWRVRWDVPLVALLRRALSGDAASGVPDGAPGWTMADVLALEPGPAAPRG